MANNFGRKPRRPIGAGSSRGQRQSPNAGTQQWKLEWNPYNFVSHDPEGAKWREPAPNLKKAQGLSGKLACTIKTETPLMIGGEREGNTSPYHIEFFQRKKLTPKGGQELDATTSENKASPIETQEPVIPGSSLRGAIRSVFEAVTNSCFRVFDGERLHRRAIAGETNTFLAGRVLRLPQSGAPGEISGMGRAWIAMTNEARKISVQFKDDQPFEEIPLALVPSGSLSEQTCWVKLYPENERTKRRICRYRKSNGKTLKFEHGPYLVTEISLNKPSAKEISQYHKGILKITAKSLPGKRKKRERVFIEVDKPNIYKFQINDVIDYNHILEDQKETHKARQKTNMKFDMTEKQKLKAGSLVYFNADRNNLIARKISRVEIPRLFYESSREKRLPKELHPCDDSQSLCPACRLFGFVHDNQALASRLSFSDARPTNEVVWAKADFPLKALSSPQPTSVNLYLKDPDNSNIVRNYDGQRIVAKGVKTDDGGKVIVRGRKFYWRHGESDPQQHLQKYHRPAHDPAENLSNNIHAILKAKFEFTIKFCHLEDWELGGLIYTLELEDDMRHALGMGKPFGFGRVKIEIDPDKSEIIPDNSYTAFEIAFAEPLKMQQKQQWLTAFKQKIKSKTQKEFNKLLNIQKLKTIMTPLPASVTEPHYPHGRGFEIYRDLKDQPLPELKRDSK